MPCDATRRDVTARRMSFKMPIMNMSSLQFWIIWQSFDIVDATGYVVRCCSTLRKADLVPFPILEEMGPSHSPTESSNESSRSSTIFIFSYLSVFAAVFTKEGGSVSQGISDSSTCNASITTAQAIEHRVTEENTKNKTWKRQSWYWPQTIVQTLTTRVPWRNAGVFRTQ
jgi:hypothetical protein